MGTEHGQATLEYAALVLLALVVLGAGIALAGHAGIAEALVAQVQRAICLVRGGECGEAARAPCVTVSRATHSDVNVRAAIVRFSGGQSALREQRSDGSVVVRLLTRGGLGLEVDAGVQVSAGGWKLGGSVGGVVEGRLGRGRTWTLTSDREADRLMEALSAQALRSSRHGSLALGLRGRRIGPPPEPDETWGEQGLSSELRARLGRAGFELEATDLFGSRTERASGARTLTIRRHNSLSVSARVLAGARGGADGEHDELYGLRVDGAGRPVALTIVETLRLDGGARLPVPLRKALGDVPAQLRAGRLAILERHLDLTDGANLAAARPFVRALRAPRLQVGEAVAISAALGARLAAAGGARALLYDLDAERSEVGGKASLGVGAGGRYERSSETLQLLAASARAPGGPWRERGDCLRAA